MENIEHTHRGGSENRFEGVDYFTDPSLIDDPYSYFEYLRSQGPVCWLPNRKALAVTGIEEAIAVLNDSTNFSSAVAVTGPVDPLPFVPAGDDVSEQLAKTRMMLPTSKLIVTLDGEEHTKTRALLMRLLTPARLRKYESVLWQLADQQIDAFIERGRCELIHDYASPYAMLVIANLLGVPEADQKLFREKLVSVPAQLGEEDSNKKAMEQFMFLLGYFSQYISNRREHPQDDVLTELATAKFPDGSTPEVMDVVWVAAFLFGAGQDTTARVLSAAMRILAERPDLQTLLRNERERIPAFVEEVLRLEGPVKVSSRLALRSTTLAGVDVPAGTVVCIFNPGANRDPRRFEMPEEIRPDRPKAKEHLAFGRGAHVCAGAALARSEGRISLERLLDRLSEFRLSEERHGSEGQRRYSYEPTYMLRGLQNLHLEFSPNKDVPARSES